MKPIIDDSIRDYQEFLDFAGQLLEVLDENFTSASVSIAQRPFLATYYLITSDIYEPKNITKKELLEPPWYYYWYIRVKKWYIDKYGEDAVICIEKHDSFNSYILIRKIPYSFIIPTNIMRKGESDDTFVLHYPNKLITDENPFYWIISAPIKSSLSSDEFEKLMQELIRRTNLIRSIHSLQQVVISQNQEMNILLKHIPAHLEWFVDDYLLNRKSSIGIWELSFAVESALKFNFFTNSGHKADKNHKLQTLYNNCLIQLNLNTKSLKYLTFSPIAYRYGEKVIEDCIVIDNIYTETLEIIEWALSTSKTDFHVSGDGIKMVIRNPYYH